MYCKDLKVGTKVVPVIRTTSEGALSTSKEWKIAQEKGQKFLYLVKVIEAGGKKPIYICAVSKDAKSGDRFNSIDLRSTTWKGWDSRKEGAKHITMAEIKKRAEAKKLAAKKAPKKVAKKSLAKKVAVKKPAVKADVVDMTQAHPFPANS
jgi:hypothetical protein